jgi:hypothetical protein
MDSNDARARARHHDPREELRVVHVPSSGEGREDQPDRHPRSRRLRRRGRARAVDGRRRAAARRRLRGPDAADALRAPARRSRTGSSRSSSSTRSTSPTRGPDEVVERGVRPVRRSRRRRRRAGLPHRLRIGSRRLGPKTTTDLGPGASDGEDLRRCSTTIVDHVPPSRTDDPDRPRCGFRVTTLDWSTTSAGSPSAACTAARSSSGDARRTSSTRTASAVGSTRVRGLYSFEGLGRAEVDRGRGGRHLRRIYGIEELSGSVTRCADTEQGRARSTPIADGRVDAPA